MKGVYYVFVIKEFLGPLLASQGTRGNILRQHLGVRADSPIEEFITVAKTHSVFELELTIGLSLEKTRTSVTLP